MDTKESIWSRRNNNSSNLSLSTGGQSDNSSFPRDYSSLAKRTTAPGASSSHGGRANPFGSTTPGPTSVASPSSATNQFGLGSGAFGFSGSAKTPKAGGNPFEQAMGAIGSSKGISDRNRSIGAIGKPSGASLSGSSVSSHSLRDNWVFWFRPPISKANGYVEYEKSIHAIAEVAAIEDFWSVYQHLKRPSQLPEKSDYHLFKKGIRPIWEDEENKLGGKWVVHLKKGIADRLWEDMLLACVGNQFGNENLEICGVVLSVRSGEDTLSVWTRHADQRNVKIRDSLKRALGNYPSLNLVYKSHDQSREKAANNHHHGEHTNKRTGHHNKGNRQAQDEQRS